MFFSLPSWLVFAIVYICCSFLLHTLILMPLRLPWPSSHELRWQRRLYIYSFITLRFLLALTYACLICSRAALSINIYILANTGKRRAASF
jgi:hypothetical protein